MQGRTRSLHINYVSGFVDPVWAREEKTFGREENVLRCTVYWD